MRGSRAKMLRRLSREYIRPGGPWYQKDAFQTGWYGQTFVHGGMRRAYLNAKALWRAGVRTI
jgi:hypothetical protein